MKATQGNRRSLRTSVLFAAVAGLAVSASGCIIDGSDSCAPDLTVSWRIISNLDSQVLTCYEAGNADTITAWIDGVNFPLMGWDTDCPANQSQGQFVVPLDASGYFNVSVSLYAGANELSKTPLLVQYVDCSGRSATPRADLFVNF